jgi:flagellar hook-length control protein FliK
MPQIAIVQATAPQVPPPGPQAKNDSQNFAPHLDKAIAGQREQPPSRKNGGKVNDQGTIGNEPDQEHVTTGTEGASDEVKDEIHVADETAVQMDSRFLVMMMDQIVSQTGATTRAGNPAMPILSQYLAAKSPLFEFLSNNSVSNNDDTQQQMASPQSFWTKTPDETLLKTSLAEATKVSPAEIASFPLAVPVSETKPENNGVLLKLQNIIEKSSESGNLSITVIGNTLKGQSDALSLAVPVPETKPENNGVLLKLQNIIETNSESGNLSITVIGNTLKGQSDQNSLQPTMPSATSYDEPFQAAVTSGNFSQLDGDSPGVLMPNSSEMVVEKVNQNLASTRHSIHQQYYEEKIAPQYDLDDQTSEEGGQPSNTFSPKTASTGEGAPFTVNPDQTNTFAQPLAVLQEGQKLPAAETLRPVTLPSGTVVHQEEVIRQIAEHFQISRRDFDTKVSIQLHPAELGEMKISLSVKEGAVRANVVASSQYAQEILEKNMVKLRAILETQGFTIDEISVTAKSDTAGDSNLFDRQLFSQNDYQPPAVKNTRSASPLFTLEETAATHHTTVTGVNVKA